MRVINKHILIKIIQKNKGNTRLIQSIEQLINDIEQSHWKNPAELTANRPDADCVYGGEFYFFNIHIHRAMILIEFTDNGEATIVWAGNHDDYEKTFKNNRNVIKKWLSNHHWIQ
ncbi:mRNA interferase HigB [Breznakibacter xylanolyticus]|uniref:mRNA interferase HigB n=1 Tax=Breznakibacter xylanolyticus TaxID=990 RepID=A0A2W7MT59_9BACT|nr:type II toxin-antitoxin system HigB family toxin [Breznakibacter xylanolyticus]PZX11275.1 mRNA interferase HigB [Breznakibacter xylanolyticus]